MGDQLVQDSLSDLVNSLDSIATLRIRGPSLRSPKQLGHYSECRAHRGSVPVRGPVHDELPAVLRQALHAGELGLEDHGVEGREGRDVERRGLVFGPSDPDLPGGLELLGDDEVEGDVREAAEDGVPVVEVEAAEVAEDEGD